ncbi:tryptophan--tRNA ligase [Coralloluteibacterium stylophorae]|uniref:Tryptophan--tRNA ligase n=1 Tax=Coralloluteibacterium stylophorae TaxID=1776034 RepID=A0A8J7VTA4_9GAMM|nr:tryptophan--tRNA ligase [Coralloluteibacterium stylophorae]MBS7458200.1 tryptophan--tRNA ligase [Coralloluteibacterium stylophorae]
MRTTRVLTGITTSGTPHLGNYVGAIRPAIRASRAEDVDSFFFLADYHALIKVDDPARVARSRLEIAATWLACGLDPERVTFYRQSDIPEIPELTWYLTCVAAKGLLNRAHAYKAAVDRNAEAGEDADAGVTAGLYMYPVLMAADILAFNAHKVPVGRDQIQHIEMARDLGQRFNHLYGAAWRAAGGGGEPFVLPEVVIEENVATLPGLDGRKMSKSYDNTIPLFAEPATIRRLIASIVTDSSAADAPKDTSSNVFQIYQAFADADETAAMRRAYADGISWGEAKQALAERIESEVAPMRERYRELMARPDDIEAILHAGAARARALATPLLERLRRTVGLGSLLSAATSGGSAGARRALPGVKQYREDDGFRFKLVGGDGATLVTSVAFASPRECGQALARLRREGLAGVDRAQLAEADGIDADAVAAALAELAADEAARAQAKGAA